MTRIVHDTTLLDPQRSAPSATPGMSIVYQADRVTEVGHAADFTQRVSAGEFEQVIDGRRHILMPGLVNTHHHLYQSLTRGLRAVQDQRLFNWLLGLYDRWRNLDYEAVNLAAKISIAELLLHGCTTTSDHFYMFPPGADVRVEAVLDAAEELGIRIHLCRGSMSLGRTGGGLPPDDCVESDHDILADCERVLDAYHDPQPHALRRIDLAPCSPFNVTPELLRDTRTLARERGVLLHTHLAETLEEQTFCLEKLGCRPVQYLADLDWLGPDVYLAHCVWLDDAEIDLISKTKTAISLCPTSNMRLGSGLPRINDLLAAGVRLGIGVDGSSSNDAGNLLAEARHTLLVARVLPRLTGDPTGHTHTDTSADPGPLTPAAVALELATVGGAAVLNRPELGHLQPGSAADFALFSMDDITLAGAAAQDPLAALVLCEPPRADRVVVAGREVIRAGRVVALDETRLAAQFNDLVAARFAS